MNYKGSYCEIVNHSLTESNAFGTPCSEISIDAATLYFTQYFINRCQSLFPDAISATQDYDEVVNGCCAVTVKTANGKRRFLIEAEEIKKGE